MGQLEDFPFYTSDAYRSIKDEIDSIETEIKAYENFLGAMTEEFRDCLDNSQTRLERKGITKIDPGNLSDEMEETDDEFIRERLDRGRDLGTRDVRLLRERGYEKIDALRSTRQALLSEKDELDEVRRELIGLIGRYRDPKVNSTSSQLDSLESDYDPAPEVQELVEPQNPVTEDREWLKQSSVLE